MFSNTLGENNLPAHIAFTQSLDCEITANLSNSTAQTRSVKQLCDLNHQSIDEVLQNGQLSYAPLSGSRKLRDLIVGFHQQLNHHTSKLSADNVLTFCGAQEALFSVYQSLLSAQDEVLVCTPCYPSLSTMAEKLGAKVKSYPLNEANNWQIVPDKFLAMINNNTKLIVLNSPHNPSGSIIDSDFAEKILATAKQFNCYVLCDDVAQASNYYQFELSHRFLDYDKAIVVSVLSKSFGLAGIRIGWAVSKDETLLKKMLAVKAYGSICSSVVDELLAIIALENHQEIISKNNDIILANINSFQNFIDVNQGRFSWSPPKAGLLALVQCHLTNDMIKWSQSLATTTGILTLPIELFGLEGTSFRLGLGSVSFASTLVTLQHYVDSLVDE
jgi:aspartate/methionine/tyrosine aminotransferase